MKRKMIRLKTISYRAVLLFSFMMVSLQYAVQSQPITFGQDSVKAQLSDIKTPIPKWSKWSRPGKAALLSALIPGLGQAYNRSYWKIPLIYAGGTALGFALRYNHKQYVRFQRAYKLRTDNLASTIDEYAERYPNTQSLIIGQEEYRRRRDYTFLFSLLFYGLNVSEAYVHAHLKDFDVSDHLTLRVQPDLLLIQNKNVIAAFSLSFNMKK